MHNIIRRCFGKVINGFRGLRGTMDLRKWLSKVEEMGQLQVVEGADPELEIGVLTELNAKRKGPALLFDRIKGHRKGYRLLTGALLNCNRMSLTLGVQGANTDRDLVEFLEEKTQEWETKAKDYSPQYVKRGPVMENTEVGEKVDITKFPAPRWNELDGGKYLGTGCAVITQDPDSKVINVGTYRIMIHDGKTLGLFIQPAHHGKIIMNKYHSKGKPCPVAVSFGHDPIMMVVGGSAIPYGVSEYNYAGAIRRKPVRVVKGPVTGLPIPADSELAIEGYCHPDEKKIEGPFGEYTGYYAGGEKEEPVLRVKAAYYRTEPILLGAISCKPPHDYSYLYCVMKSALVKDSLMKAGIPDVKGVWFHEASGANFFVAVSVKQRYLGHVRQAGHIAAQCQTAGGSLGRYVVVVDDDIDPMNLGEVIWAMGTRTDPERSIDIIKRAYSNRLDPVVPKGAKTFTTSRAVIDACKPFEWINDFPEVVSARKELKEQTLKKWSHLFQR